MTRTESFRSQLVSDEEIDFVLITALAEERDALLKKLPGYRQLSPSGDDIRIYFQADLPVTFSDGSTGIYRLIITCLLGMGRVHAAAAAADAIRRWHPRYIFLIGIAGGMACRNIRYGDILIPDQIVDYEIQKITPKGPEVRWEVYRADPRLLDACNNFRNDSWKDLIQVSRPDSEQPIYHIGPIVSGDKVIAFGEFLTRYGGIWPKLIGVEMEAAGVATAAFQSADRPGFFMVRGVSDLADENKGSIELEAWRLYACDVTASFAIAFLKSGPIPLRVNFAKEKTNKVEIILEGEFDQFTKARQQEIVDIFATLLKIDPIDIRVLSVIQGSIVFSIELPESAANRLYILSTKRDIRIMSLGIKSVLVEGKEIIGFIGETSAISRSRSNLLQARQTKLRTYLAIAIVLFSLFAIITYYVSDLVPRIFPGIAGKIYLFGAAAVGIAAVISAIKDLYELAISMRGQDRQPVPAVSNRSVFAGEISDSQVQIDAGDKHYRYPSSPKSPPSPLFTISSPPLDFIGRAAALKRLADQITHALTSAVPSSVAISGITGGAGIGKSALAYQLANQLKELFPDAKLEINLQGVARPPERPLTASEAMRALLSPFYPGQSLPETDLRAIYIETFRKRKCLLLLDNAADAHQVRTLLPPPPSAALVTSRTRIDIPESGLSSFLLDLFNSKEARSLLRKVSSRLKRTSLQDLDRISALCGYLPLALRVAARIFQDRPDWDIEQFINLLQDQQNRLSTLQHPTDQDLNVISVLELSYLNLSEELKPLFRALGVFPAPFNECALAVVWEGETKLSSIPDCKLSNASNSALGTFLARNLLDYRVETKDYSMHELIRIFAHNLICKNSSEAREKLNLHSTYYLCVAQKIEIQYYTEAENIATALHNFKTVIPHLNAIWHRLTDEETQWPQRNSKDFWLSHLPGSAPDLLSVFLSPNELIDILISSLEASYRLDDITNQHLILILLGQAYIASGDSSLAIKSFKDALKINKKRNDYTGEGIIFNGLGVANYYLGNKEKSIKLYERALSIARNTGNRLLESNVLGNLGNPYRDLHQFEIAIDCLQQALTIAEEFGDLLNQETNLGNLGLCYRDQGNMNKALDYFQQALDIALKINNRSAIGNHLHNIGSVYLILGQVDKASDYFQQALTNHREIRDLRGEANDLASLGDVHKSRNKIENAIEFYKQSLAIAREISYCDCEIIQLSSLGIIYRNMNQPECAIEYFNQAVKKASESRDLRSEAQQLGNLGTAYQALGEPQKAINYHLIALEKARKIGDLHGEASDLGNLGLVYSDLNEPEKTLEYFNQAIEIFHRIGDFRAEAKTLNNLGGFFIEQGELQKAIEYYNQALEISHQIGDPRIEGITQGNLGNAYAALGEKQNANEHYEQALAIFKNKFPPDHPLIIQTQQNLQRLDSQSQNPNSSVARWRQ